MVKTNEPPIIADTSGLVSLAVETDHNHKPAIEAASQLRETSRPVILPSDVLVETVNILGKRISHEIALGTASELLRPESQFIPLNSWPYLEIALQKFKDQPGAVSLTDCLVMAGADDYGTKDIFGFDQRFEKAGYKRIEPSTEWK